jgi:hypothetical protein
LVNRKLESANLVLNDFVSDTEKERFSSLIAHLDAEALIDFEYEGYEIGRLTSYETLIKFKKIDLSSESGKKAVVDLAKDVTKGLDKAFKGKIIL